MVEVLPIDTTTRMIINIVQILGGLTMLFAIWISWKQLRLSQTEVIKQNQKIIELLTEIKNK